MPGFPGKPTRAACAALVLILTTSAHAVVIDFEGVASANSRVGVGNTYSEDGFDIFNFGDPGEAAVVSVTAVGLNATGTDYYVWNDRPINNPIVLDAANGNVFSLESLDVGSFNGPGSPASFEITGFLSVGGMLMSNVVNAAVFSPLNLNWSGLTRVEFQYVSGDLGAIDNISLNTVPEPTTLALFGLALAGVGFARRRLH